MAKIILKTSNQVVPMIYAYTTPEIARHNGWTKIGYTEQDVDERIKQQTYTADIIAHKEWQGNAIFEDGSGESFTDKQFHAYLRKLGIEQEEGKNNEWFKVTGPASKNHFIEFRENHGIVKAINTAIPYNLREEQERAVKQAFDYANVSDDAEFLWNAKPRFGKTLGTYDLCKRLNAQKVLIVTNRPAIANSWYEDYCKFLGEESGYKFVSTTDALKGKAYVLDRNEFIQACTSEKKKYGCIEFVSLQDLKGSIYFGGKYDKLKEVEELTWDILVIDEAHEGVDTYKTDLAFERIKRNFTLHLSGTPFKALANDKFAEEAIFNWTYADEQRAKENWSGEAENPYGDLPKLQMFTYQMSEIIKDEIDRGIEINGETEEYAFDLNEFFKVENGKFVHNSSVDRFLDALTQQEKFPFSTEDLRNEIKHSLWLFNRVDSAKAIAKKLNEHPVFSEYKVVIAAGDGKIDENDYLETKKAYDNVVKAIRENDKTITLSVGKLTTGVTIPEWTAVLMLSNIQSASLYMQSAFRAQNPCLFSENGKHYRKETSYVFDFDPARTLIIFEQFANDLSSDTANGKGDTETRKKNIKELLNFFPVLGEDEDGEMVELDPAEVLSIPRKIKSTEVVRRGFMSNFLFQNISNVFNAPREVMEMIGQLPAVEEPKKSLITNPETKKELCLNKEGEVELPEEHVIGKAQDVFGEKIYDIQQAIDNTITETVTSRETFKDELKQKFSDQAVDLIVNTAKASYGSDMKPSDAKAIKKELKAKTDKIVDNLADNYEIQKNLLEKQRKEELQNLDNWSKNVDKVNERYDKRLKEEEEKFKMNLQESVADFAEKSGKYVIEKVETKVKEREKNTIEDAIRDHLRGFSRTIPSFLMAYGDDTVTLATFDTKVPGNVFEEVTSITLDQFKFLRDGGKYTDEETGEEKEFKGHLFDSVVFDDSVKEFLRLKEKLSNYFDEKSIEDIFDYIPPQKTNQIYTPKDVVKRMVDMLEAENPGCFDKPDKTFIDMYMKSGLYIAEIVKRLYQSEGMKKAFPNEKERLKHIFANQVYGLAPTEIIYKIATNFILGFDSDVEIENHNFRQVDALPYAKEGKIQEMIDELFDK